MSTPPATLLLLHGWALKPGLWRGVTQEFSTPCSSPDLGYFGPVDMAIPPDGPLILAGHSLGFLWWLNRLEEDDHLRQRTRGLISIHGFTRFARAPDFPHGTPQRVLQRMEQRLAEDPRALLEEFGRASGLRAPMLPDGLHPQRLAEGLSFLATWDGRPTLERMAVPLLVLAAEDDAIVPPALTRASFPEDRPHTRIHWHPTGHHLLPLTQPAWCARRMIAFLDELSTLNHW